MNGSHWWRLGGEEWLCRVCGELPRHPVHWLTGDEPESRVPRLGGRWFSLMWPALLVGAILGSLASIPVVMMLI
jgi:hypothetical protein